MLRLTILLLLLIVTFAFGVSCPNCDANNPTGGGFCHECGSSLPESHYCPGCCSEVLENDGFCPSCGMKLDSFTKRVSATFVESIQPAVVWIEGDRDRWFYLAARVGLQSDFIYRLAPVYGIELGVRLDDELYLFAQGDYSVGAAYLASISGYESLDRQERFMGGSLGVGTHQNNIGLGLTWRGWLGYQRNEIDDLGVANAFCLGGRVGMEWMFSATFGVEANLNLFAPFWQPTKLLTSLGCQMILFL